MLGDKLSRKEKIGLGISLVFLAAAFLDRLMIHPLRIRFHRLDQQIRISEKQVGGDVRNVRQKDLVSEEYERYLPYIKRSGSDEEEAARLLGEIEALARKSSVYLVDMKPRRPRETEVYKEYAVEIEAEGQMEPLMGFMHQVNTSPQLLRIETLRLTPTKAEADILRASLLITKVLAP